MAAYLLVRMTVGNQAQYDRYRAAVGPVVAAHGGRFIVRGGVAETLEGAHDPRRHVALEFPSADAARRFWNSPEYVEVKKLRAGAAELEVVLVEGAAG